MTSSFVFSRSLVQDILAGAQDCPNDTRCGLICGSNFEAARVLWVELSALDTTLAQHPDALATLVTHPDTPPEPSVAERELPRPQSQLLLIASLNTRGVLEMRAFDNHQADAQGIPITLF
nr:hypothetical protein [Oceanococcus sp. HetDA_MAG_MS8]